MANNDTTDPLGNGAESLLRPLNQIGRGIQLTGSGAGGNFDIGAVFQGYSGFGLFLNGTPASGPVPERTADIHIVPPVDDTSAEIEGFNAAGSAGVWKINSIGTATFSETDTSTLSVFTQSTLSGTTVFNGNINQGTALQHSRGAVGCSTAGSVGAICASSAQSWSVRFFANTTYTLSCSLFDISTGFLWFQALLKGQQLLRLLSQP